MRENINKSYVACSDCSLRYCIYCNSFHIYHVGVTLSSFVRRNEHCSWMDDTLFSD